MSRPKRDKEATIHSLIRTYRQTAAQMDITADECRDRADERETKLLGHECGHIFTITASSITHSGIAGEGPESHRDAPFDLQTSVDFIIQVRAHDLPTALRKAAAKRLSDWHTDEEERINETLDLEEDGIIPGPIPDPE